MIRNLYFFLIVINLSTGYLFAMKPEDLDSIYNGWVSVSEGENKENEDLSCNITWSSTELKNISALAYAIKHGGPPKIIKKLASSESREKMLHDARLNLIKKSGKRYALEKAIQSRNLNFIKTLLGSATKSKFRAHIFGIALLYQEKKVLFFIANTTPKLFISRKTLPIINQFLTKVISEQSLRSIKIIFRNNFVIPTEFKLKLLNHCLEECQNCDFEKGRLYLARVQQTIISKNPLLLYNTL